jgi:hypothetical protein
MNDFIAGIARVRDSVAAVMKITRDAPAENASPDALPSFGVAFVGTAWCVVRDRYFVTAHHVFNNGAPREPDDRFVLFFVPGNGLMGYHTPVTGFAVEDASNDMAIIEIAGAPKGMNNVPALPVAFDYPADGNRVLTYGFPSPVITAATVDVEGNWSGGQLLLKSHANEGIVAGQYDQGGAHIFELNVGWHHGESGGPVVRMGPVAAFALMQSYRGIQSPNGVYAGPHQGRSMSSIRADLTSLGITSLG